LAEGVAQITAAVIGVMLMRRLSYQIARPRYRDVKYVVLMTAGVFVSRLAVASYQSSGVLLLGLFSTPSLVAVYALAEQIYRVMQQLSVPVVQALYPYMAKEKNLLLLAKVAMYSATLACVGATAAYFALPVLLPIFFEANWDAVIPVFNVFALAIVVNIIAIMLGYPLAAALGSLKVANSSVVYGAVLYVALAATLMQTGHLTPVNLAWLMVFAEFYVLFHRGLILLPAAYRLQKSRNEKRNY
jgi:PST family polysaccharide transporter